METITSEKRNKDTHLYIRISREEKDVIFANAERAGLPVSQYLRFLGMQKASISATFPGHAEIKASSNSDV